jgi:hypothetical protein
VTTWFIPLTLLGYYAMLQFVRFFKSFALKAGVVISIALLAFSGTLYQSAQYLLYQPLPEEKYNFYLDPIAYDFIEFGRNHFTYSDVVLSNEEYISMLLGGYTRTRLYLGHAHQTIQYRLKKQTVDWFFAEPETATAQERKKQFLNDRDISYVILYKPSTRTSFEWMNQIDNLYRVYDSPAVSIFEVGPS